MSETRTPVEVTTRYATTVSDLVAAWSFVMDRVDDVGPDPSITIEPVWAMRLGSDEMSRHFAVVVSGMVEDA